MEPLCVECAFVLNGIDKSPFRPLKVERSPPGSVLLAACSRLPQHLERVETPWSVEGSCDKESYARRELPLNESSKAARLKPDFFSRMAEV